MHQNPQSLLPLSTWPLKICWILEKETRPPKSEVQFANSFHENLRQTETYVFQISVSVQILLNISKHVSCSHHHVRLFGILLYKYEKT